MPVGVLINSLSIIFGGLFGFSLGKHLQDDFKEKMNMVFGACSIAMGITAVVLVSNMSAVIFALVFGTILGLLLKFGDKVDLAAKWTQSKVMSVFPAPATTVSEEVYIANFVTVIVLFCASGTGIYGSLESGMTGEVSTLVSKSILDFFTAAIFASQLGYLVSFIAVPQFLIFSVLYYLAGAILPLTTPEMINDFKACGGVIMVATGFRILQLKKFPTVDMTLAMLLVMPISWIWVEWIVPLLT